MRSTPLADGGPGSALLIHQLPVLLIMLGISIEKSLFLVLPKNWITGLMREVYIKSPFCDHLIGPLGFLLSWFLLVNWKMISKVDLYLVATWLRFGTLATWMI